MKLIKIIMLFCIGAFLVASNAKGQANPTISVIGLGTLNPTNSGEVALGAILDLRVDIGNTGSANIVASKLRPVITVPALVTFLPDAQQTGLPAGWVIVSNTGSQLRICNGSDIVPGSAIRTIILKVQGATLGGPQTFLGQLNFGGATCAVGGPAPSGNNIADDVATSTITVTAAPLPVTLLSFNATLSNCQPILNWLTESEINSDRFEIERGNLRNSTWKSIGMVAAKGGGAAKTAYNFIDTDVDNAAEKILYRLKMIDKDGQYKYSKILPVLINCKTKQVEVYPNPVKDGRLYVNLTGANGYTEATLLSLTGQVIMKQVIKNGTNYLNISPGIAAGLYLLNIKDENGVDKKTKVLIQH